MERKEKLIKEWKSGVRTNFRCWFEGNQHWIETIEMNDIVQEKLRMERVGGTKYCGIVFPQIEPSL